MIKVQPTIQMTVSELETSVAGWRRYGDCPHDEAMKGVWLAYGRGELVHKSELDKLRRELASPQSGTGTEEK